MENRQTLSDFVLEKYRLLVSTRHPERMASWPMLGWFDLEQHNFGNWLFLVFRHHYKMMKSTSSPGAVGRDVVGFDEINPNNREQVRARLEKAWGVDAQSGVVMIPLLVPHLPNARGGALSLAPSWEAWLQIELEALFRKHERHIGLGADQVFLSHRGADKPLVRRFKTTLELLGFKPWIDEDAMNAGVELERGLLAGFEKSCAVVFFVTPSFRDENYIASEVDYAIAEKRKKGDKFAIITIVFPSKEGGEHVPTLLRRYVWKSVGAELDALQEILKAMPVSVGPVYWK